MEIRHLRTFAAAAEHESFTLAAESLKMTQSAASQHIAALEKHLGVSLFERQGRSVSLTAEGRNLYRRAREILDLVDKVEHDFGQSEAKITGTLRIATSTVPAEWLLPELLAGFRELYPGVRESVSVSDSRDATRAVEQHNADVGFIGEQPRSSSLIAKAIAADELVLIVSPDHRLASRKSAMLKDLRSEPLIIREAGSGSRRCVEKAVEAQGLSLSDLNLAMEMNSNEAIRAAVERGAGVAFLSCGALAREMAEGRFVRIKLRGFRAVRQLYIVICRDRMQSPLVGEFLAFVDSWRKKHPQQATSKQAKTSDRRGGC